MEKKLYKSRTDKMLDGVCAGVAKYADMDVSIVRLILVAFSLMGGAGVLLYIIAAIVLPREPEEEM